MKKIPYLTTVGSIMYAATATHPDVAFAIQHLSQFNTNPGNAHWTAAQCTIRYLYATRNRTLVLGSLEINLTGWVDSDWGPGGNARTHVNLYLDMLLVWVQDLSHGALRNKRPWLHPVLRQKPYGYETF